MLGIPEENQKPFKLISFPPADWRNEGPHPMFYMEDGASLAVKLPDKEEKEFWRCEKYYDDPMHVTINSNLFHIHEFAERAHSSGIQYEPAVPIKNIEVFRGLYLDRNLCDCNEKPIPYRLLWCNNAKFLAEETWKDQEMAPEDKRAIFVCPDAASSRRAAVAVGETLIEFCSAKQLKERMDAGEFDLKPFERKQIDQFLDPPLLMHQMEKTIEPKEKEPEHIDAYGKLDERTPFKDEITMNRPKMAPLDEVIKKALKKAHDAVEVDAPAKQNRSQKQQEM